MTRVIPRVKGAFAYELNEKHPLIQEHFKDIFDTLPSVRARDAKLAELISDFCECHDEERDCCDICDAIINNTHELPDISPMQLFNL